jgi:hypothetical protein
MDKEFCKQIDEEDLIEKYIAGKLHGELLNRLTEHLQECVEHNQAVNLEKALSRGVRDFARSELKSKLRHHIKKHEISKYYILRYAAILIVAIMAPIILYYQLVSTPADVPDIAAKEKPAVEVIQAEESAAEAAEEIPAPPAISRAKPTAGKKVREVPPKITTADDHMSAAPASPEADLAKISKDLPIKTQIENVLNTHEDQLIQCMSGSDKINLNQITIELELGTDGIITASDITSDKPVSEESKKCITEKLSQFAYPAPASPVKIKKIIELK